jgi:hypothetical protein
MPTAFTKEPKPTTTFAKESDQDFLLKEDAFYLLLESGGKIVLRRGFVVPEFSKEAKPTTTFTKESKP